MKNISKEAIWSITCGGISFFVLGWLSFVGLGFGIRSLINIKKKNEKGVALAIIGIIVSVIAMIGYFYALGMF